jgi:hypothetical protein
VSNLLAVPADLTGSLLVLCLPLRQDLRGDDLPALPPPTCDEMQPFLPARAGSEAGEDVRSWAWPQSRLLAYRRAEPAGSGDRAALGFGRSVATVEERVAGDQPVFAPESSCASLWHVPGRGVVLVLERLRRSVTAGEMDDLAAGLREGHTEALLRHVSGPLLAQPSGPITLGGLLGRLPDGLQADQPVEQLLVHRPYVTRGARHVEGLLVGLAAGAGDTVDDLVGRELDVDDVDAVDRMQEDGHFWLWSARQLVHEPAQKEAGIAVREDGRAAFVDLEAMSIYHDYLGVGGDTIVLEALPLVAERAAEAADFWLASDTVGSLDGRLPDDIAPWLDAARGVRARIEQRTVLREMLHTVERFTTWTHGGQLWSTLHRVAEEQESSAAQPLAARTTRAIEVADSMLRHIDIARRDAARQRQAEAREREQEQHADQALFLQRVATAMAAVAGLIGAVVLFTALAAIPQDGDRAIEPLLRAGFIATAVGVGLSAVGYLGLWLAEEKPVRPGREKGAVIGAALLTLSVVLSTVGGIAPQALGSVPLFVAWGLALAGGTAVAVTAPVISRRG